jgi:hypothetical protein
MARAVLKRPHLNLLIASLSLLILACAAEVDADSSSCPAVISPADPALQRLYVEFKRSIEAGPLVGALGRTSGCKARAENGAVWLEYAFAEGGKLEAYRDPAIEFTEQRVTKRGLSRTTALALLQRTEQWGFDGKGCNIQWTQPPAEEAGAAPNAKDLTYRGDLCNCQGRLEFTGGVLTGFVFRSAC